jgi:hypothetical protein
MMLKVYGRSYMSNGYSISTSLAFIAKNVCSGASGPEIGPLVKLDFWTKFLNLYPKESEVPDQMIQNFS